MSKASQRGAGRILLFLSSWVLLAANAAAADDGYAWLQKIEEATHKLSYEGIFVYQHNHSLEAVSILHAADKKGNVRERLVSLTGAPREIVRDARQVTCYLPDQNSVVVEHRAAGKGFPAILPARVGDLTEHYVIETGPAGRVAGMPAQLVTVAPRDQYRYGYHLWADKKSGLLLKAVLVTNKGKPIEQFMFTELKARTDIKPEDIKLQNTVFPKGVAREEGQVEAGESPRWAATDLPPGFELTSHLVRTKPGRDAPVQHLLYSDGLAAVSVFIEKVSDEPGARFMEGPGRMGAVHAYGKRFDGHQIMVVGEVPAATVNLIGQSVKPVK